MLDNKTRAPINQAAYQYSTHEKSQYDFMQGAEFGIAYRTKELAEMAGQGFDHEELNTARDKYGNGGYAEDWDEGYKTGFERAAMAYEAKLQATEEINFQLNKRLDELIAKIAELEARLEKR